MSERARAIGEDFIEWEDYATALNEPQDDPLGFDEGAECEHAAAELGES